MIGLRVPPKRNATIAEVVPFLPFLDPFNVRYRYARSLGQIFVLVLISVPQ